MGSSVTETDIRMHEIEREDQSRQNEDDNTDESAHNINREPEPTETESETINTPENGRESEPKEIITLTRKEWIFPYTDLTFRLRFYEKLLWLQFLFTLICATHCNVFRLILPR
ncbi:hypothetical protein DPMN_151428 [Dreissena polymorpha]|uniref:Uncharacterized protein n=1 Tax=Dreissena polymorpha TaxID=45954 RepID=A0A9D4J488_DREPO|nr:hypothetical protein DPMN_151428 [Dreissena polymorpha]